ncbi:MAG: DUF502 domain-containing protein [Halosimplex sp.]
MVVLSSGPGLDTGETRAALADRLRQVFLTGAALTIPLLITVIVLAFVVNFVLRAISPVVAVLSSQFGIGANLSPLVMKLLAIVTLIALVFVVGLVAEARSGDGFERVFDTLMARIPGIGSVYTSFNEMTELLLSNDAESFREVKLVEFPREGSYSLAFVTAESPPTIAETTDHDDVTTLFMPLAPNPVMGGYVIHVSTERVYDVDLTVEEGIRSIVTSGVATGQSETAATEELMDLERVREQARDGVEDIGAWGTRTVGDLSDLTGEAARDLREQARRELAAMHPDLDESEIDDEAVVRHYMLSRTDRADESTGDASEAGPVGGDRDGDGGSAAGDDT